MALPPGPPSHLPPRLTLQPAAEPLLEFPESYSKFPMAICFTNGIVSFCFSLHTAPLLPSSHLVQRSVLYVCFSTAALKIEPSVRSLQIPHICVSMRNFAFSF